MDRLEQASRLLIAAGLVLAAANSQAHESGDEYIDAFDTRLELVRDQGLVVSHRIGIHPHGDEIRRGVFFELPEDVGPLNGFEAWIDGQAVAPEIDDGKIVVAAGADLDRHRLHLLEVRYRAPVPLRERGDGRQTLDWAVVIDQFELPWRAASLEVHWPRDAMPAGLPSNGEPLPGGWRMRFAGPLAGGSDDPEPDSVRLTWPAGAFADAQVRNRAQRPGWRIGLAIAMVLLWALLHGIWRAVGRDPKPGSLAERSRPPDGISPAAARFVEKMGFDNVAFVAALVSLHVKGHLALNAERKHNRLVIERRASDAARQPPSTGEQALLRALFADEDRVELKPGTSAAQRAAKALDRALGREHRGRHFVTNPGQRAVALIAGFAVVGGGIAALIHEIPRVQDQDPLVIALGFAAIAFGLGLSLVYFEMLKAPTRAGESVRRQIAGLRKYLQNRSRSPGDAAHFIELLPYAVALECEDAWQARFAGRSMNTESGDVLEIVRWYESLREEFNSAAAIVPIIAASAGATAATGAGGASAGGV